MTESELQHPESLLPWYVNGSLSVEENDKIKEHLRSCGRCREAVAALNFVRDGVRAKEYQPPSEFAWQRLKRDMRNPSIKPSRLRPWWLPSVATAAILVIVVQAVLLFGNADEQGQYQLAGVDSAATVLQIKFNPNATEKEIRELLGSIQAEMISGPGARGIYRLQVELGRGSLDDLVLAVRRHVDVVDYVEAE